jgi:hypothetical protein
MSLKGQVKRLHADMRASLPPESPPDDPERELFGLWLRTLTNGDVRWRARWADRFDRWRADRPQREGQATWDSAPRPAPGGCGRFA